MVLAATAAVPTAATAASWGPVGNATRSGQSVGPAVAANADGRFAVGFVRYLGSARRAEVRTGRLTDRLRGDSVLLDSSTGNVDSVAVTFAGEEGPLGAAWRRSANKAQRLRGAAVGEDGDVFGPYDLTTDGTESAYAPRWIAQPEGPPLLVWDRRTTSAQAPLDGVRFGPENGLPGTGISSQVSLAIQPDGSQLLVWLQGGRVVTALSPAAGQPFGTPVALSGTGTARDPQLAMGSDGTAVAAWVRNAGAGNVMEVAARPSRGTFGAPVALTGAGEGAFTPKLAASSAGGFLAAWVAGPTGRGWGSASGAVRAEQLVADGTPSGLALTLSPAGARIVDPSVTGDGRGGVMVGWRAGSGSARQIVVRRVARDGVVGSPRTLDRGSRIEAGSPVMAGSLGRRGGVDVGRDRALPRLPLSLRVRPPGVSSAMKRYHVTTW